MSVPPEDPSRAAELDYQGWVRTFADTPGVEILPRDDLLVRRSDAPHVYLSAVFGAWLEPDVVDERIREVIDDLGRDGRAFIWSVWPSDTPDDLTDRLLAAGFEDDGEGPLMACRIDDADGLEDPPPSELEVRQARTPADVDAIADFALEAVGDEPGADRFHATIQRLATEPTPRLRLFGGWVDGQLVSSSGLFTGTGAAGIYAVGTTEAYRGRGYGRALTAAAMVAGRHAGLTTSVLLASDLGQPVYRRLGFREVGRVRFLVWPGRTSE